MRLRAVCGLAGGGLSSLVSERPLSAWSSSRWAAAEEEEGKEDDRYGSAQCRRALHGAGLDQFGSAIVIVLQQSRNSQVSPVGERLGQYAGGDGVNRGSGLARLRRRRLNGRVGAVAVCWVLVLLPEERSYFLLLVHCYCHSIGRTACRRAKIWIVGQSVGRPEQSVNQRASQKTVLGPLLLSAACPPRKGTWTSTSSTTERQVPRPALWGGDLSKVRSGPVFLAASLHLWQLGSDLASDG